MEWNDLGSPGTLTCLDLNSPMGQVVILDDPFVMIPWWPGMLYGRLRCLPDRNHQGLWHVSLSGGRLHELGEAVGYFWRIYTQILYLKTLYHIGMTTSLPKWFLSFRKNNLLLLKKFTLSELNPISKTVRDRTFNCSGKQKIFLILQDMKKMLTKAGGNEERTVFLFSDTQIKDCGGMTFTCRIRWGFIQRWSLKMASCSCQSNLTVLALRFWTCLSWGSVELQ